MYLKETFLDNLLLYKNEIIRKKNQISEINKDITIKNRLTLRLQLSYFKAAIFMF